jgi:hypothetical protein
MMELFNSNGISYVAAAFFTGLFAFLGVIYTKTDKGQKAASDAANKASNAADKADNVSNGFTEDIKTSLTEILEKQEELNKAMRDHFQWHIENPPRKRF